MPCVAVRSAASQSRQIRVRKRRRSHCLDVPRVARAKLDLEQGVTGEPCALQRLAAEAPHCCIVSLHFLPCRDICAAVAVNTHTAALARERSGCYLWIPACQRFLVDDRCAFDSNVRIEEIRRLARWSMWPGSCSLPLHVASCIAVRALRDFKVDGFGPRRTHVDGVLLPKHFIDGIDLNSFYKKCKRSLLWRHQPDDCASPLEKFQNVTAPSSISGYGSMRNEIEVACCLGGCTVSLIARFDADILEGSQGSVHSGELTVRFGNRPRGQFGQRRRSGNGEVTMMWWECREGDLDCIGENQYHLDAGLLQRLADHLGSSTEAALQILWRVLGSPFRWTEILYPYAEADTFYLLLRNSFIKCFLGRDSSEELFTARSSGPTDSDFIHDISALRAHEFRQRRKPSLG